MGSLLRIFIFLAKDVRFNISDFYFRLIAYVKFNTFFPSGAAISYPKNVTIGKSFSMGKFSHVICQDPQNGSEVIIGDNVAFNHHVFINADCGGKIRLGNNVIIGPMTMLRASNHHFNDINKPIREQGHNSGYITLEDDVWLGGGVIVLPNVTIGKGSVIGAGSIVTKDIPPYSVAVGNPARVIRQRV